MGEGEWVTEGRAPGDRPAGRRVAYHVPAWLSPWVSFSDVVVSYLRGRADGDLTDFHNGRLGLPSEEITGTLEATVFERRSDAPARVVPSWATAVVAGADTQVRDGRPYWVWTARAWGKGNRSRLVEWGRASTPDELVRATLGASWEVEGQRTRTGARILLVDSGGASELEHADGNSTLIVYEMARRDPGRIIPVKGASQRQDRLIRSSNVAYTAPGQAQCFAMLHTLDTERLKDVMAALIRAEGPVIWEECQLANEEYGAQMSSEEKTRVKIGRRLHVRWLRTGSARNDLWDASGYSLAGAMMLRADDRAQAREHPRPTTARADQGPPAERGAAARERRIRVKQGSGWVARR